MQSLVIYGTKSASVFAAAPAAAVTVDGVTVGCGLVNTAIPAFDPGAPENARRVVTRVNALSCNYRDKGFFHGMQRVPTHRFTAIGSEFVGEVIAVGNEVRSLRPGDRVIPNHEYHGYATHDDGVRQGIATNQASRAYHVLAERKLARIPHAMPDEVAAGFSVGAQTAYSMVRRLHSAPGGRALVTAASSNTSLFLIAALRRRDIDVYAATTSPRHVAALRALGVKEVLCVSRAGRGLRGSDALSEFGKAAGGFDYVLDPFFDLHLQKSIGVLNPGGVYVTCGLAGQTPYSLATSETDEMLDIRDVMSGVMQKNLTIIGNCIGLTADLDNALADYDAGTFHVVVDSVYSRQDVVPFIDRTYNTPERFGKVVFQYAE
jgi:NADPH:quinone reductase-like Zn-dependent oxidoreductase